ncbi:MAG: peptidoglycan/LPS O-acetylase OafA/YrhL [Ilumatobacter sp.]
MVSGGFIGVDVFFVISGYLITALALAEIDRTDRLALGSFWARRARRLLPAMLLVCAAVLGYSVIEGGGALQRVGRDVGYALLYVANWGQVGQGRDYFALYESPSLLEHAWSLAVEEQFYLVWPIVLVMVLRVAGKQRVRRAVAGVAIAVAAGSVVLATVLASDEGQGLSRLYFGTDTRAVGLAVGATAGAVGLRRAQRSRTADIAGLVSVLGLVAFGVTLRGDERWLYGPGFLMIALLSITAMWAATSDGLVQQVLSNRMLVGVGRVSYGVYLLFGWPGVGGGRELDDGTVITPCEAGFDDRWRFEYQAMIGRFEESATVVFSSVAPPAIPIAERRPGTGCLNAASDDLDGNRFDYSNWLCPDGDCEASEGLRSDGIHFRNSAELQEQVLQALLDQVLPVACY